MRASSLINLPRNAMESDLEVVDMAKCLMLLAESGSPSRKQFHCLVQSYECRTCRKSFSSFQALGGHRASHSHDHDRSHAHKKQRSADRTQEESINASADMSSKSKSYKCSVCASKFSSGQALGGHMRKHRSLVSYTSNSETTSFDLNLPPQEEG